MTTHEKAAATGDSGRSAGGAARATCFPFLLRRDAVALHPANVIIIPPRFVFLRFPEHTAAHRFHNISTGLVWRTLFAR